ncbi:N-formylkynurenine (aryl-) formamidase [Nonlabens ulvanivorans]|uniref:N-formylkynurenine (Aryl-) formamidase n=1 Tax=Nonlabens ulvanivorans TaxID=906888 RepID=A0A090X150_NONUL|nr:cyclase family protein [Nonlabens ulvanivorans]GAL73462.1 N-formylkynurenine (aryl-) formamidase [Nonlabens ulvanivorans]
MQTTIQLENEKVSIDLSQPLDISLAIQDNAGVGAWYIDQPQIKHVEVDGYVGNVKLGGSTNFNNVHFNPHSHGTHTECIGHITEEFHSVNKALDKTFFKAQIFSIEPDKEGEDQVITPQHFQDLKSGVEAIIIRTLPNGEQKNSKNYSNTNPPYILEETMIRFRESGIKHILIDLPSVDKEKDDGALLAHKAFWNFNGDQRLDATITELIYVPDTVKDGFYMMDLQIAPLENDAAPSRPILYSIL